MYDIKRIGPKDAPRIVALLSEYHYQTPHNESRVFNFEVALDSVRKQLSQNECFCFLVTEQETGEACGFAQVFIYPWVWEDLNATIELFYIKPEYRGSSVGRELANFICEQLDDPSIGYISAGNESGLGEKNDKIWENLFKKQGFIKMGSTMGYFRKG